MKNLKFLIMIIKMKNIKKYNYYLIKMFLVLFGPEVSFITLPNYFIKNKIKFSSCILKNLEKNVYYVSYLRK